MAMQLNNTSSGGCSTAVMELPSRSHVRLEAEQSALMPESTSKPSRSPSATEQPPQLQKWNSSRVNTFRTFATLFSFFVLGLNDAAYGALIPYLEEWYNVNYTIISLVFLSPIVGYTFSALLNNHIHVVYGQRGVAWIMSVSHLVGYTAICVHPPYPVLVVVYIVVGFGNGLGDSAWNAWIGDMANANEILGFLHGFYGLGGALSPLVATTVVTKKHSPWHWYEFYYLMVGAAAIEVVVLVGAFWKADGPAYRAQRSPASGDEAVDDAETGLGEPQQRTLLNKLSPFGKREKGKSETVEAIKNKTTILTSLFLLIYVGAEVSIGGWIVTFMLRVRHGPAFGSGMTSTGFWLGVTVGRFLLGFVTERLFKSERWAVATYLVCSVAAELVSWLVDNFYVSAVMIGFVGFFLGPMFPAGVVVITKLLPKRLHVPAVGFAAAFGASGATIFPFAVGAIANAVGVKVLQPIILAMLVLALGVWMVIPRLPKQRMA
ncbi:major facilitator superfamily domain-containing protein [Exophiala viscosa]|uniref:major facilitator superfamily domain-containing protein n=1 Tax=Exophiala viscosa TaxID=2486360 RepID=UPI002199BF10|nr:major facilitator superfamily domain-containing protein [Exophiala viscosa]